MIEREGTNLNVHLSGKVRTVTIFCFRKNDKKKSGNTLQSKFIQKHLESENSAVYLNGS